MRILLIGLNYSPEPIGIAVYTTGLAEELAQLGHDVRVISGQPYYPAWRVAKAFRGWWRSSVEGGVSITRCPIYVPQNPTGLKRIVHHASFAVSALVPALVSAVRFRPDVVFTVAPSLIGTLAALASARLARTRSWLHVQDFEVEAAFATGLMEAESKSARAARALERQILRRFDRVSSISPEMCRKLVEMGIGKQSAPEFRNWADIDRIKPLTDRSSYRETWGITTPFVALYSGNIANKQGIEIVLEAAKLLDGRRDLTFVICGEGPNREAIAKVAATLPNVRIHDLQPVERLGELLGLATVHLLPQKAGAADLVLPSKLTNMLASGRPVIATAAAGTGLAREVMGCGVITAPGDAGAFAQAIEALLDDDGARSEFGRNARSRAESHWSRTGIIAGVERQIIALASPADRVPPS